MHKEKFSVLNIYAPNARASIYNFTKAQNAQTPNNRGGRLQYPTLTNGLVIETENKQRHTETKRGYEPNSLNGYLQNISP